MEVDRSGGDTGESLPQVTTLWVSDGYLETIGLQIVRGRWLGPDDGLEGSEVAVVNERFEEVHLEGADAVGRRVRFVPQGPDATPGEWLTIVGVIPNIRQRAGQDLETDAVLDSWSGHRPTRVARHRSSARP